MPRKKCQHGYNFFCSTCSKLKMVICLKTDAKPLYGNKNSITRYSVLTQDKRPEKTIIEKMSKRLLIKKAAEQGECFEGQYNKVLVFDNVNNTKICEITP